MISSFFPVIFLFVCNVWRALSDSDRIKDTRHEIQCGEEFIPVDNENGNIKRAIIQTSYERDIKTCQILLEAKEHHRLRAVVHYIPNIPSDCETQYLHIGNDKHRLNKDSLTSYKFCNRTISEEIVSRRNFLWIVYTLEATSTDLRVTVSAHEEVTCYNGQFECSPVQCVKEANVCDKITQCNNGRDEYCVSEWDRDSDTGDFGEPCFQCADGSCIRPTLPRYHDNWGKPLWYLCDNVTHCKDGTDERTDICKGTRGRTDKVVTCHSAERPDITKRVWKTDFCDGKEDCEKQKYEWLCNRDDEGPSHENVLFVPILIVAIATIVIATGFCIVHKMILLRERPPITHNCIQVLQAPQRPSTSHSQYRFNICHGGRPSLDTMPEEKQCFISSV